MKACSKFELAQAAGVSPETFRRWLRSDKAYFEANGISPSAKILPPGGKVSMRKVLHRYRR